MSESAYTSATYAANWIEQVWRSSIHITAYNKQKIVKNWTDLNEGVPKMSGTFNYRKHANLSRATIATNTDGTTDLSFVRNTEAVVSKNPVTFAIPVSVTDELLAKMILDPRDTLRNSIELSLAEGVDAQGAAVYSDIVTNSTGGAGTNISKSVVLDGIRKMATSAKMYFNPGETPGYLVVHPAQIDDILSIPEVTQANIRGDSADPNVQGWVWKAYGLNVDQSANISTAGGQANNLMFIPQAFGIGYNQKIQVKLQDYLLAHRIIGWTQFIAATLNEQYAVLVASPSS